MASVNVYGSADTHLSELAPTTNFGSDDTPECGWLVDKAELRVLLRADLSAYIAAGSTITDADLHLYIASQDDHNSDAYTGYHNLQAWVEGEATWNIYSTGNNWGTAGAHLVNTDYETSPSFGPWDPEGTPGYSTSVDCTSFVQDAWANQGKIFDALLWNNMVPGNDEVAKIVFHQRGYTIPWYIAVTYTPPAGGTSVQQVFIY